MEEGIHHRTGRRPVNWKRPVPLWMFLIGILATASATSGAFLLPSAFGPKPDFIISSFPSMYLQAGYTNTTLISIQAIRNFTGILTVTVSSPSGLKTALQDSQTGREKEQILLGTTGNLSLAVNDQKVGYFSVAITASSGATSHTQSLIVIVQNITVTAIGGSHLWIPRGSSANVEFDLSSVNGLSGNVSFVAAVYEGRCGASISCPLSVPVSNASFSPRTIILSPRSIGKTTLTINVAQSDTSTFLDVAGFATTKQSWSFPLFVQVTIV